MFITIVACGMNYHENKLVRDGGDAKKIRSSIIYVPVSFREDLIDHFFFFFFCRGGEGKKRPLHVSLQLRSSLFYPFFFKEFAAMGAIGSDQM